jgi:tryptophanyl-tRNA synthetase
MRVLSGIQPSGKLHLGNYFGAMRQYVELQEKDNEGLYFIANYHALTSVNDAETLREYTREIALGYLAVGIDPAKSIFFRHSDVPEVCELAWILTCITPMSLLQKCVSYKDKIAQGLAPNSGLFSYPVLQAADILIYQSNLVPVGQDQKQHLEVTRDIALKFNNLYGETFEMPEPYILSAAAVVPGIDGEKMSKSYDNTLELFEPANKTKKKIMRIVTDSTPVEDAKDPDTCTIFALLKLVTTEQEQQQWRDRYTTGGMGYGEAKKGLLEKVNLLLDPFRQRYEELAKDMDSVEDILTEGGNKARQIAQETMERVRSATGIMVSK